MQIISPLLPKNQNLNLQGETLELQQSSYYEYLGKRHTEWVKPQEILGYFSKTNPTLSYESFVNQKEDLDIIKNVMLED